MSRRSFVVANAIRCCCFCCSDILPPFCFNEKLVQNEINCNSNTMRKTQSVPATKRNHTTIAKWQIPNATNHTHTHTHTYAQKRESDLSTAHTSQSRGRAATRIRKSGTGRCWGSWFWRRWQWQASGGELFDVLGVLVGALDELVDELDAHVAELDGRVEVDEAPGCRGAVGHPIRGRLHIDQLGGEHRCDVIALATLRIVCARDAKATRHSDRLAARHALVLLALSKNLRRLKTTRSLILFRLAFHHTHTNEHTKTHRFCTQHSTRQGGLKQR